MSADRLEVSVTFDQAKGYIGTAPELRQPVTALSLGGLRRRIEIALLPDNVSTSCCGSMASPSANATVAGCNWVLLPHERHRRGGASHAA